VGEEVAGLDASGAAVSWTTRAASLALGEGVGVGLAASPAAVRVTFEGAARLELGDSDRDAGEGVLPGSAAGVSDETDEDDDVAVAG